MQDPGTTDSPREARTREMYSRLRYPGLDPQGNATYVRHRRFVYGRLGLDVDTFFQGKRILDAGCGTGEETIFLASLGPAQVIGIDTSDGSLEAARESARRAGVENVEFRRGSVLDERVFPEADFDYVSSLGCIHHTPDTRAAFRNLCRMVRPGGYLCTFIYNSFSHFLYNLECDFLDWRVGEDVDERVRVARRLFDWRRNKTFFREGVAAEYEARLYDKYGVLYRDSLSLGRLLSWYAAERFAHAGSFPMCLRDMLDALRVRDAEGRLPGGTKGRLARVLDGILRQSPDSREWSWRRRVAMQGLLLTMGFYDYGSSFRVLGRKEQD